MNGPRLGDMAFFNALDLDRLGLESIREAVSRADWPAARREFVRYLKARERPFWFSNWRERKDPHHRYEVELVRVEDDAISHVDLKLAEKVVSNTLTSCDVDHVFNHELNWELNPVDFHEWTWQLSRHPFWVTLGQAFWKTGDEKFARAFVRQMTHWVLNVLVPVGEDGNTWKHDARMGSPNTNCWRTIECGIRAGQTWPYAFFYFLPSEAFTEEAVCLMLKSMVEHARHLLRWPQSGNWLTMEANGLYHLGVLFPEFKESAEWRRASMERLHKELDNQVYPDGAQMELSPSYHQVSLRNFVMAYNLGSLNGQPIPSDYVAKLERLYNYDLYLAMPDLRMPALNDGDWTDVRPWMKNALDFFPERQDFQWAASGGKEGERPVTLSIAFPYAGHFVMRSGWEENDGYLLFDGGPHGYDHQHEDKLNIVLYAQGRVHLTDPGTHSNDHSKWHTYVRSTRAHNTVLVDGLGQNRQARANREAGVSTPLPHTWVSNPSFDFASASYEDGYGAQRSRGVTHTRSILFIKPDVWIVTDFLRATDGAIHRYEALFHLDSIKVDVVGNGKSVETCNRDAGNLGIYGLVPEGTELDCISGQEEPVVQGWIPRGKPSQCIPLPTAVYTTEGGGTTSMSFLLAPIAAKEISPVSYAERLTGSEGTAAGRVLLKDGRMIHFAARLPDEADLVLDDFRSDGEAFAIVEVADGTIAEVMEVNGSGLKRNGHLVQLGEQLNGAD